MNGELAGQKKKEKIQEVTVEPTEKGYEPSSLKLKIGIPVRITFIRKIEKTCGTKIAILEFAIKRDLPLSESVVVEFTPEKKGEFAFTYGMGMLKGQIIVQQVSAHKH